MPGRCQEAASPGSGLFTGEIDLYSVPAVARVG